MKITLFNKKYSQKIYLDENQKKLILFTRFQIKKLQEKGIKFPITFL